VLSIQDLGEVNIGNDVKTRNRILIGKESYAVMLLRVYRSESSTDVKSSFMEPARGIYVFQSLALCSCCSTCPVSNAPCPERRCSVTAHGKPALPVRHREAQVLPPPRWLWNHPPPRCHQIEKGYHDPKAHYQNTSYDRQRLENAAHKTPPMLAVAHDDMFKSSEDRRVVVMPKTVRVEYGQEVCNR
jgi:hypothetical protein